MCPSLVQLLCRSLLTFSGCLNDNEAQRRLPLYTRSTERSRAAILINEMLAVILRQALFSGRHWCITSYISQEPS